MPSKLRNNKSKDTSSRTVFATVRSISSGRAHDNDDVRRRLDMLARFNEYHLGIHTYAIDSQRVDKGKEPYQTFITLSARGASIPVQTKIPFGKDFAEATGSAVLYSHDPEFLMEALLQPLQNPIEKSEIEDKIDVIQAQYLDDIIHYDDIISQRFLVSSAINSTNSAHAIHSRDFMKNAGSAIKKTGGFTRSNSIMFWTEAAKNQNENVNLYLYCNPENDNERLFIDKSALERPIIKSLLKSASIKITDTPCTKKEAYELINRHYPRAARDLKYGIDPYDSFAPERDTGKWSSNIKAARFSVGKNLLRTSQRVSSALAKIQFLDATLVIGGGIALYAATQIPFLLLGGGSVLAVLKAGTTYKTIRGVVSAGSRGFMRIINHKPIVDHNSNLNLTKNLRAQLNTKITLPYRLGQPFNAKTLEFTDAWDSDLIANTAPNAQEYTPDVIRSWAMSYLLNPYSAEEGIIMSEEMVNDTKYMLVRQPSGIDTYFHPHGLMSLSKISRPSQEHSDIPKPVKRLFDEMPEAHNILGVSHTREGELSIQTFSSFEDVPKCFVGHGSISLEQFEQRKGYGSGQHRTPKHDYLITDHVSLKDAKSIQKKGTKEFEKYVKSTLNPHHKLHREFENRVASYCEPGSHHNPYQDESHTFHLPKSEMTSLDAIILK